MHRAQMLCVALVLVAGCADEEPVASSTSVTDRTTTTLAITTTTSPPSATTTTLATTTTWAPLQGLAYEEVASLEFPIQMIGWGEDGSLIATKDGQVWLMGTDGEVQPSPVLDISEQVHNEGERGLLSIVGSEDGTRLYAHYSGGGGGDTVVSRFTWADGALTDEQILFEHDQPAPNHNGGMLQFGPDGGLYLGLGDGGGANDQFGHGQDTDTLLAGIVRLDPNGAEDPLLWQYGLRNPWRFWFEGDLVYIADVGQNAYEEINVAPIEEGLNYGWSIMEGLHCFRTSECDTSGLTLPVVEVEHGDAGTCSITGGVVYHGAAIPEIDGQYFYSDYCGGYLRSFLYRDGEVVEQTDWTEQVGVPGNVVGFGVDSSGEMYVMTTDQVLAVVPVRG
jgi:glucose/arabinose dehydrogenase